MNRLTRNLLCFGCVLLGFLSPSVATADTFVMCGGTSTETFGRQIWTVDTVTGIGTLVGSTGASNGVAGAFAPSGTYYTVADDVGTDPRLATVSLTTGIVTPFGSVMSVPKINCLQFGKDGTLYSWRLDTAVLENLSAGTL